jgi:hypothetical protein
MTDPERLACNLLSSAPLVFNLFAPMAQELPHASSALNELFPIATADVRRLLFEHSPGRGDLKFLGDYSAFDLLIEYVDMLRPRYAELAEACELFIDHAAEALRRNPLQQLLESTY